jgi:hypothetical protein
MKMVLSSRIKLQLDSPICIVEEHNVGFGHNSVVTTLLRASGCERNVRCCEKTKRCWTMFIPGQWRHPGQGSQMPGYRQENGYGRRLRSVIKLKSVSHHVFDNVKHNPTASVPMDDGVGT